MIFPTIWWPLAIGVPRKRWPRSGNSCCWWDRTQRPKGFGLSLNMVYIVIIWYMTHDMIYDMI
jgi:hypothetical protein